jgi:hypothetical protein
MFDSAASRFKGFYISFRRGYSIRSRVLAPDGTPRIMCMHLAGLSTLLTRLLLNRWAEREAQPSPIPTRPSAYPDSASMYRSKRVFSTVRHSQE